VARWLLVLALAAIGYSSGEAQRKIHRGFRVDPTVAIRIHNLVGSTTVTGWALDSVEATGTIPANGGSFYGGGAGAVAKLGIEGQDLAGKGPGTALEIRVPRGARVWIKSATAMVHLRDLTGEVEVSSVTGAITLGGTPRVATLETIDGELVISGAATVVRARTGSGAVRIEGVRGDLTVATVQGPITVQSDELLAGRIESVSGSVTIRAGVPPNGQLEVETHDGTATLVLPAAIDARFDLSTVKGTVVTRFADGIEEKRDRIARFSIGKKAGAGRGAAIAVRTFSGNVRIETAR
jgi:DUF4097 and DUF4098 domain-containing protein YvlB